MHRRTGASRSARVHIRLPCETREIAVPRRHCPVCASIPSAASPNLAKTNSLMSAARRSRISLVFRDHADLVDAREDVIAVPGDLRQAGRRDRGVTVGARRVADLADAIIARIDPGDPGRTGRGVILDIEEDRIQKSPHFIASPASIRQPREKASPGQFRPALFSIEILIVMRASEVHRSIGSLPSQPIACSRTKP